MVREKGIARFSGFLLALAATMSAGSLPSVPRGFLVLLCSPGTLGGIAHGIVPSQVDSHSTAHHD